MLTIPERAELYRLALTLGQLQVADAVAWADQVIVAEANPPGEVLDVSMGGDGGTARMISLLRAAAGGDQAPGKPRDAMLGLLSRAIQTDPSSGPAIAAKLKALAGAYDVGDATNQEAARFAVAYGEAERGSGTREAVTAELRDFLLPFEPAASGV